MTPSFSAHSHAFARQPALASKSVSSKVKSAQDIGRLADIAQAEGNAILELGSIAVIK
jgi:hypothetical protein